MMQLNNAMLPFDINLIPSRDRTYIVGGSTRDLLLGQAPADYDMAVQGNPETFAKAIAQNTNGRLVFMGKPGKMVYRVVTGTVIFDITPLRGTIETDLALRDFTINAMAYDLSAGRLTDPFDGRRDLATQMVRMVSETAFRDDPLRLLRAHRMATALGFTIDPETLAAIKRHSQLIRQSAGERIREEVFKIFSSRNSHEQLMKMADSGLLFAIFPELLSLRGCQQNRHHRFDVFVHTLTAYAHLERLILADSGFIPVPWNASPFPSASKTAACLKFALLLHDIGKPASRSKGARGNIHFYGHEAGGVAAASAICDRIRCSREEHRFITSIISLHSRPLHLYQLQRKNALSRKAVTRFFMACGKDTPFLLLHAAADMLGKGQAADCDAFIDFLIQLNSRYKVDFIPKSASPPLLTGEDLISEFGLKPSPLFKTVLERVEEARLSGKLPDRAAALALVERYLRDIQGSKT